eukprot:1207797-Prymnesium_polylepis.2
MHLGRCGAVLTLRTAERQRPWRLTRRPAERPQGTERSKGARPNGRFMRQPRSAGPRWKQLSPAQHALLTSQQEPLEHTALIHNKGSG